MRHLKPKASVQYFSLLIFLLTLTLQACFVEQVVAAIAEMVSHDRHNSEQHGSDTSPPHRHDENGHNNVFCCDNILSSSVVNNTSRQLSLIDQLRTNGIYFCITAVSEAEDSHMFSSASYSQTNRYSIPFRSRDKYALSSLLHAPPSI